MRVAWLVVVLALIVAAGPLLWLWPSRRDRLLVDLRGAARGAGLAVELASVPKLNAAAAERVSAGGKRKRPRTPCAAYRLALTEPLPLAPKWLLLKTEAATGADAGADASADAGADAGVPVAGWTLVDRRGGAPDCAGYWRQVGAVANALPGGCLAVAAGDRHVSWLGRETLDGATPAEVVSGIRDRLEALAALQARFAATATDGD